MCLVLEYMNEGSLDAAVKARQPLPESQIAHIGLHSLRGLQQLHSRRLIHRDIKPSNILLGVRDGVSTVKLSDFGILREFGDKSLSKTFTGTLAYMSPERIGQEERGYSYPADIWGLGLSLLTLALGRNPLGKIQNDFATISQS